MNKSDDENETPKTRPRRKEKNILTYMESTSKIFLNFRKDFLLLSIIQRFK